MVGNKNQRAAAPAAMDKRELAKLSKGSQVPHAAMLHVSAPNSLCWRSWRQTDPFLVQSSQKAADLGGLAHFDGGPCTIPSLLCFFQECCSQPVTKTRQESWLNHVSKWLPGNNCLFYGSDLI